MSSMTLKQALAYADRAIAKANELGLAISLVVVDEFGQLVQLDRMDGAPLMSPDIAEAKAYAGTFVLEEVTILDGKEVLGAIGISGANGAQEEAIARFAIAA